MQSKQIKKVISVVFLVLFAAFMLLALAAVWSIIPPDRVADFANKLTTGNVFLRIIIGLCFVGMAVAAIYILINLEIRMARMDKSSMNLLGTAENGAAYVSSSAIDSMVQRCVKRNKAVKECSSIITAAENGGVIAEIRLVVFEGANMPTLCASLQQEIKAYVESSTGIAVKTVTVSIVGTVPLPISQGEKRVSR